MATKLLCYAIFILVETSIILGSIVVVVVLYLPFVAIKGVVMTISGRATPRLANAATPAGGGDAGAP